MEDGMEANFEYYKFDSNNQNEAFVEACREGVNRLKELKEQGEYVKTMIDYDYSLIETHLGDNSELCHVDYVEIIEDKEYKNCFYPNDKFYTVVGDDDGFHYMRQDDEGSFHNLVWQISGVCEDDYRGCLLFPLTNGKYWRIEFWS